MANQKHPDSKSDGEFSIKHWTDSFPHSFHGWGPQTPTPDNELPQAGSPMKLRERDELTWHPENDKDHDHIVWRYDGTRH